jgi:RND family efflux transporter MFP subunit
MLAEAAMRQRGTTRVNAGAMWCGVLIVGMLMPLAGVSACGGSDSASGEERPAPIRVGPEDFAVVREGTLERGPILSGRLTAERQATVRAEAAGTLQRVEAEPGQRVREGQVLARIEDSAVRNQLLSARSSVTSQRSALEVARRDVERMSTLVEAGAAARSELEATALKAKAAEAQLAEAEARLALANEAAANTTVRAPISGVVSERPVNAGDVVQVGTILFTIVDPSSMRLEAAIPAGELSQVDTGDVVKFEVTGYSDREFEGRVTRIFPTADPATGQVRLIATLPNTDGQLVGGLFARGRISVARATGPIAPAAALTENDGAASVTLVRDGSVRHLPVDVVLRDPLTEQVVLLSGVRPGDAVLLGAAQNLSEGTDVRLEKAGEPNL